VSAEIFQCIDDGKTTFSDVPCGDNAKLIHIEPPIRSGAELSNRKLKNLADDMHSDRMVRELEHQIERQFNQIENIESAYLEKVATLETELRDHKALRNDYKWSGNEYKRNGYYKKKNEIEDEISSTRRQYRSDRRLAYIELSKLKERLRKQ
tara:strand:+ start:3169 stop:3624 length:456 start_codon:yes stop_codon:yes gene_type:complete